MKKGLLLKDAPEPIHVLNCYEYQCGFVAHTSWDFRQHMLHIHGKTHGHFELTHRPTRRILHTKQELINRRTKGVCHCGKNVVKPRRMYCSKECTDNWYDKTIFNNQHRDQFLSRHSGICEHCGTKARKNHDLEMDHIIALILGGHPWDERNLQALCYDCHKIKSKSDITILAWWKRQSKYCDLL